MHAKLFEKANTVTPGDGALPGVVAEAVDDDVLLNRQQACAWMADTFGEPARYKPAYLAKLLVVGGGPRVCYCGPRRPAYRKSDLRAWIVSRLRTARSTSDREAA